MTKIKLIKQHGVLLPFGPDAEAWMNTTKAGQVIEIDATRPRNWKFMKKYFALLNYAFAQWDIPDNDAAKDFDEFRKDLAIFAGYYKEVPKVGGGVKLKAKSISFNKMKEEEFQRLYSKTIDVLLDKILQTHPEEDVHRVMNQLLGFM